jgi:hypothetical protein
VASYLTIQPLKEGDIFPEISGKTLAGRKIMLPTKMRGKISIMIFYFYQEARPQAQAWYNLLITTYNTRKDIILLEVPMIRDYARLYSFILDRKLKWLTPRKKHENVVLYYGKLEKYYYHFNVNNLTDCYVFVLDKEGKVCTSVCGEVTPEKLQQISTKLETPTTQDQLFT